MYFNVIIPFVLYWAKIILHQIAVRMEFKKREKEREREYMRKHFFISSFNWYH